PALSCCAARFRARTCAFSRTRKKPCAPIAGRTGCRPRGGEVMPPDRRHLGELCWGPLAETASGPLVLTARLGELRPHFLPTGGVGRGYGAVARNGRILLASHVPVTELAGRVAVMRLQTWYRALLPGDVPEPYGLLLCVRDAAGAEAALAAELIRVDE